ncbi:MAG: GNAT family N-acetyltransferase [Pseudomonadota bacterium]
MVQATPTKPQFESLLVEVEELRNRHELKSEWLKLEQLTAAPIFLHWLWIGTWLETQKTPVLVARAKIQEKLIAIACLGRKSKSTWLHQTGDAQQDQIWIEYNGVLAQEEVAASALAAIVRTLQEDRRTSTVHLSMLNESVARSLLQSLPHCRVYQEQIGWKRDLSRLRAAANKPLIEGLSANTRAQIRRSIRRYEELYGKAQIVRLRDIVSAEMAFEQAGEWHKKRWTDSGFYNPSFVLFHKTLLKRGLDHGKAQVFQVMFGTHVIGVFYYLCDGKNARFYLQGVRYETDKKLKPGLTGHSLLMQHFLDEGWDTYDFMGGDSQYKRQLADIPVAFTTLKVHSGNFTSRIADFLRPWIRQIRQH